MKNHAPVNDEAGVGEGWFARTAGRIGDLGSPFYDEEHQRDVWNEASAVGFQLMLWLLPVAAVVSVWVGGTTAIPYALVMFAASGLASWVVIGFARARGVDMGSATGITVLRWRMVAYLVLLGSFCAGVVRQRPRTPSGAVRGGGCWLVPPSASWRSPGAGTGHAERRSDRLQVTAAAWQRVTNPVTRGMRSRIAN